MKLLFICTHNRCRSILAEAITNHIAGGEITAASAGSSPQGVVHPLSLKYLTEHGIPTRGLISQSWDEFEDFSADAVLTLCDDAAEETCPTWFGESVQVHWGLVDPSKAEVGQREVFDATIDILQRRIRAMLDGDIMSLSGEPLRNQLDQIAAQIE